VPAPSVSAAVELEKNAYSFRLPTLGFNAQLVVAVTDVLPGLLALPAVKVKFTAFDDSDTLMESLNTACNVIVAAPEFRTCARAPDAAAMAKITIPSQRAPSFAGKFIEAFALQRETVQGREFQLPALANCIAMKLTGLPAPECSAFRYKSLPEAEAVFRPSG
jgi:hypothetical protein